MLKLRKKRSAIATISMLSVLLLILLQNINISYANDDDINLTVENLNFQLFEFSEHNGTGVHFNSIDISIPSSEWNLSDIELEFTNINFTRQVLAVEEQPYSENNYIDQTGEGLAVQIQINDSTKLYGVQIYGYISKKSHQFDNVSIQIQGYDSLNNRPNGTVFGETLLNMTIDGPRWYELNFTTPLLLSKGNYSLVMTGIIQAGAKNYWYYNKWNPMNPDLYISNKTSSGWSIGVKQSPYLFKLDQEIITNFYPEIFTMRAKIDGIDYNIFNGTESGTGNLSLSNINSDLESETLSILINIEKPYTFVFNYSYKISLNKNINAQGSVMIKDDSNDWNISPQINRTDGNYSIQFIAPKSWENLAVIKEGKNITGDDNVTILENILTIKNDIIPDEILQWDIKANSPKTEFKLDYSNLKTEFRVGQELTFFALAPIIEGNFTFILINYHESEEDRKIIPVTTARIEYSYLIPSNSYPGNWTAYIFWNNHSDAGVLSQNFTILETPIPSSNGGGGGGSSTQTTVIEPISGIVITLGIVVGSAGSLTAYQTVKKVKKKRDLHLQALYNKFKDNLSLNYLMISDHKSGLNVYEQFFAGKSIDPSLLSGFLEAIRNFGIELTGAYKPSETVKLEYQNSKILMNERKYFRLILIMSADPSEEFKNSITNLADEIEEKYGHLLRKFKGGEITMFSGIKELIEKHLNVAFTYPLRIVDTTGMKLTRAEKLMIQRAKSVMKQTKLTHFYTSFLMPDQQYDPEKTKTIFNLIDKGIFTPINLNFKK